MDQVLASAARAERSRKHLALRYGEYLRAWAALRANAWNISQHTTIEDVVAKLHRLRTEEVWVPLTANEDLKALDLLVRIRLKAFVSTQPQPEEADALRIGEIHRLMSLWFPAMTRPQLRSLLFRMARTGRVLRERRGVYMRNDWGPRWRDYFEEWTEREVKQMQRFEARRWRATVALVVHYLLPHLAAYRKARALGMSERNFHYALNEALEEMGEHIDSREEYRRRQNVQS